MNKFIIDTIDNKCFNIKNSKYNNACFYESFSNSILKNNKLNEKMSIRVHMSG
jgi:hypothetical protein